MKVTDKYVFFYGSEFSNWYPSYFEWKEQSFNCAEQALMWYKAMTFQNFCVAEDILSTTSPKKQKQLGRSVTGYNENTWSKIRFDIMVKILKAKFSQNDLLRNVLLSTENRVIVEASPTDRIWGIGLGEDDLGIEDESNWKGQNLLGKALMEVREYLRK
jgi:ribA/ribD-fused uncharacterized protein